MKENRRRRVSGRECLSIVCQVPSSIKKSISQGLVNGRGPSRRVEVERPGGGAARLWSVIETQRHAEFALCAVCVMLQSCAALIRRHVHVRPLYTFTHQVAHGLRELSMKKTRRGIVVRNVTKRTLAVPKANSSRDRKS